MAAPARQTEKFILVIDGVFEGRARTAGELMRLAGQKGDRAIIRNEKTGQSYYRTKPDRRLVVQWRRSRT